MAFERSVAGCKEDLRGNYNFSLMAPSEFSGIMFVVNPRACLKFQANIFDRSRCQNCFKAFDLHRKDCGRDANQLQYGGLGPNLHTSAFNQGDLHFVSSDCNLYCGTSPEEVTASWQVESRMHNQLTSQVSRKWAEDSSARISELSSTAGTRGHSLRGEWTLGSNVSTLQGESRNRDAHTENSVWAQSRSRSNSVGSRGPELVSGERVTGRKPRVESGYFSLERAKSDSVHNPSPAARRTAETRSAGQSASPVCGPSAGGGTLLNLGRLTSSQSSFESESSWGTAASVASSEPRLFRRDYTALADIPKPKRIISREKLEQDYKQLGQRTRTRSPGREEVERLFGQERRPVTESYREFIPTNVGRTGRESTISHRLEEDSRVSKVYPRKFQQKETDREISQQPFSNLLKSKMRDAPSGSKYDRSDGGISKPVSSFSMKTKDKHRYLTPQHDKVDTKVYSQKDELKMCTKCSRVASETNKVDGKFSKEDSSSYTGYLQSAAKMDNRFSSQEQTAHTGYLRSTARRDEVEANFSERTPHPAYLRAFSRSDRLHGTLLFVGCRCLVWWCEWVPPSDLSNSNPGSMQVGFLGNPKVVAMHLTAVCQRLCHNLQQHLDLRIQNFYKDTHVGMKQVLESGMSDIIMCLEPETERGFPTKTKPTSLNKDVYPQTADKHEKTERGLSNRPTFNSLNKDVRQQATNKDNKTDRGLPIRSNSNSSNKDVYPQTVNRHEKMDRGFSNRAASNPLNKGVYLQTTDKTGKADRGFSNRTTSNSLNKDGYSSTADKHGKIQQALHQDTELSSGISWLFHHW
ncbi:uncharacterized protein LOC127585427 [Pristis pectinata]|uniref:uncharacterized protein LOC127585427 n=1 Tax=Pristis pectinata TaxID=685728 RepID=UPI00223DA901|nr:uncharacterized protein LOC127585427 [Pristis pectinata]